MNNEPIFCGIPTTIKTMGITTIAYLRVLIIEIGSTFILMVVEAQGFDNCLLNLVETSTCVNEMLMSLQSSHVYIQT